MAIPLLGYILGLIAASLYEKMAEKTAILLGSGAEIAAMRNLKAATSCLMIPHHKTTQLTADSCSEYLTL